MSKVWLALLFIPSPVLGGGWQEGEDARQEEPARSARPVVYHIQYDGVIGPVTAEYWRDGIREASEAGAEALLIEMDTPGGLVESTRIIIKDMMSSEVPIIIYVAPSGARAGSAGVFITIAGHVAAMAPGTNIGAAHPVTMGGSPSPEDGEEGEEGEKKQPSSDEELMRKIENDAAAFIRSIAKLRGRNEEWAERAVRESVSITAEEAVDQNVVDFLAQTPQEVLSKADGRTVQAGGREIVLQTKEARLVPFEMSLRYRLLSVLTNPNVAFILFMIGIYGIIFELSNPGAILPGVVGGIAIILALFAFQALPINYAGLALILLAMVLFIAEIKVTSFGLLTLGGVVSLVLGGLILIKSPAPFFRISWAVLIPVVIVTTLFFLFLVGFGLAALRARTTTGREGLVGERGEAVSAISRRGKIFTHGEYWTALSDEPIEAGEEVEVVAVEGMKLRVRKVRPD